MPDTLRFGVVGVGYFGRNHVRLLSQIEGAKLQAVSRISREYREEVSGFLGKGMRIYGESEELFKDPEIDAVIIAVPTPFHFELAKQALEAGKHVLVEKPMTRTLEEAELLRAAVARSGRVFMVGHQYLYNDYVRHLKVELRKGTFGDIRCAFYEHLYGRMAQGIGCFWETATHGLAVIDYLFSPQKIREVRGKLVDLLGNGHDDLGSVWIDFEGAPSAEILVSWLYPEKIRQFVMVGEKGSAVFDEERSEKLKLYIGKKVLIPRIKAGEPLRNEVLHFIDCIRLGKRPLTDVEHGFRITSCLEKVFTQTKAGGL